MSCETILYYKHFTLFNQISFENNKIFIKVPLKQSKRSPLFSIMIEITNLSTAQCDALRKNKMCSTIRKKTLLVQDETLKISLKTLW